MIRALSIVLESLISLYYTTFSPKMEYQFAKYRKIYYNRVMFHNCERETKLRAFFAYLKLLFLGLLTCIPIIPSRPASAVKPEDMYFYSQVNSLYYDPDGDNCDPNPTSNGKYKGAQYSFNEDQLKRLWWAASAEQGTFEGRQTELSIFANVYESEGGEPGNNDGLINKVVQRYHGGGGWFASSTGRAYETGCSPWECYPTPNAEEMAAAKDILNNGNRTLPPEVNEHDSVIDIASVSNDGVSFSPYNKAQYKSGVTIIHNRFGSTYTFFQWANGEKECGSGHNTCGDPFGYTGEAPSISQSYSTVTTTGNNTLYDGSEVLSDAQLQQVEHNKPVYEKIAKKYNFPWQLLAALHYREHNFAVSNPANGEGVYQLTSLTNHGSNENAFKPAGPISDKEFERQTDLAAQVIRGKIGQDTDLMENEGNIKRVMFMYNWANPTYVQRALDMGYKEEDAKNGEGSPYVMNMYDAERDPKNANASPYWTGLIASLKGDVVQDSRPGAFVVFQALGGGTDEDGDPYCAVPGSNGEIADTAIALSWEGRNSHSKGDPKPEYVEAMKAAGTYFSYGGAPIGASCDQFVATVMRYSGADPEFNLMGADASHDYMASHPEKYKRVEYDGTNETILQPGDIFATYGSPGHGHIWVYVEIDGHRGRADASYNDRTAEHYALLAPETVPISDMGGSRHYEVFRRIK